METIIWFNFIVSLLVVVRFLYRENRIYLSYSRTFWCKKLYGITVMWNNKPIRKGISANSLFYIPIRNNHKTEAWDDMMFKSGEYKRYNK